MKLIYIAGAFMAKTEAGIQLNVDRAVRAAALINQAGEQNHFAFCPHVHGYEINKRMNQNKCIFCEKFWETGDMEFIQHCHGLVLLPGWLKSQGSLEEYLVAKGEGIPVFEMQRISLAEARRAIKSLEEMQ